MPYDIYRSSNLVTPFLVINDDSEDTTSTSIAFIGRTLQGYGQAQNQDFLWMLEHFANGTAPNAPISGQLWYDTTQSELKVYQVGGTWRKVGVPETASSSASVVGPSVGQLFYNTSSNVLQAWTGTTWITVGPSSTLPTTVFQEFSLLGTTTNATTTEIFVGGVSNSRMDIPNNTVWTFEIVITARRTDSGTEYGGWKITGVINNTGSTVAFADTPSINTFGNTSPWNVSVFADTVNDSLDVLVTGQTAKTIDWGAVVFLYIIQ